MFTCGLSTLVVKKEWKVAKIYSVWQSGSQSLEPISCNLFSFIQKHFSRLRGDWHIHETVCREKKLDVSTSKYAIFELQITERNYQHCSVDALSGVGSRWYKNLSLRWIYSKKWFQQLCTINCRCTKVRWREPKIQCSRRNDEIVGE